MLKDQKWMKQTTHVAVEARPYPDPGRRGDQNLTPRLVPKKKEGKPRIASSWSEASQPRALSLALEEAGIFNRALVEAEVEQRAHPLVAEAFSGCRRRVEALEASSLSLAQG